jgi:integrase/recombinase XerD
VTNAKEDFALRGSTLILHKCNIDDVPLYTLFDSEERVVVHPTLYLASLRRKNRPVTSQRQIAHVVKLHCEWIENSPSFADLPIDEALAALDYDDILDWIIKQRTEDGVSETTINNREILVRGMYKWFTTNEAGRCRTAIPWVDGAFTRQPHEKAPRFLTAEQVITLLTGMHNESQRAAAHFVYDTGVRVSELVRMTRRYLPSEDNWPDEVNYYPLLVPGSKPPRGHKVKSRYTIISRPTLARVRRYHSSRPYVMASKWSVLDPEKPLFLNVHGGKLTTDSVSKGIVAAWSRKVGPVQERVGPHRLRHGTGLSVLLSEFGKDLMDNLVVLKNMLGHEHIHTTETYASIPIAALQSILGERKVRLRFEEADRIYQATYLAPRLHVEKRGHSRWLEK